ncbi:Putative serine protease HhoB [Paenibacillus polymyxa E681]|uniref:S1C family serine protease n=1 Tax=Paenibacillus polymyxa TaxID=1406 RepID=UPI0001E3168D|nr:trypsin-like peptidase domain-containing protein [Paenibacillus polymyxa]ADM69257.1 serine protease [Paenibacillus polymyxa E681]QNV56261.1 Putative serine protease HhoB [Paenibacillus polymyxa E681]QNV61098.1 Putative serine protease HhoB [Paenibacillus polymyxa E681]
MDEFKNNNSGRRNDNDQVDTDNAARQNDSNGSSYYYSYGPFSSVQSDGQRKEGQSVEKDVEITPPQAVRPLPPSYHRATPEQQDGSGRNGGNWQFKPNKPKSQVKTIFLSFLAGMLVITVLMYTADRTNMFTPETALTSAAAESGEATNSGTTGSTPSAVPAVMPSGTADIQSVVAKAGPAVVKIETLAKQTSGSSGRQSSPYYNDPLYQYFFGNQYGDSGNSGNSNENEGSNSGQLTPLGIGSGFIFDKSGYVLTNNHVVEGASVVQVTVEGTNKPYEAKVLGKNADLDLAVLKIEGKNNFPTVTLGDSDNAKVGEWMVAIGNPEGFEHSVTAGVLSAKERTITINSESTGKPTQYKHLIQTDASINPGNSGGPLLNLQGQVIGMNVAVSADAQGIGFAIPSNTILEVVDKLKNNQPIPKEPVPFIGASLLNLSPEVAKELGTSLTEGSVVRDIIYKSPAYQADLRPYDVIIGANGTPYSTSQELIQFIQKQKVGTALTLNIERAGQKKDVQLKIGNKNDFSSTLQQ